MFSRKFRLMIFTLLAIGLLSTSLQPVIQTGGGPVLNTRPVLSQSPTFEIYHGGTVDTIRVVEYNTLADALTAVNSGDADIFGMPIEQVNYTDIASYPNLIEQWAFDTKAYLIALNTESYPLGDAHLRRAIAYAIDKTDIAESAMNDLVDTLDFVAPLNNELSIELDEGGIFYDADSANAVGELALAGMLDIDEDGVVEGPDGSEIVLSILYPTDVIGLNETASAISSDSFDIGLNNTLVPSNYTEIQTNVSNHTFSYDIALFEQEFDRFGLDWAATNFHSTGVNTYGDNIANIDDDTLNDLSVLYAETSYLDLSIDLGQDALRAIRDICPVIPLFGYRWLSVYTDANFDGWLDETNAGAYSAWNPITIDANTGVDNELVIAVLPDYFESYFSSLNPFTRDWIDPIDMDWVFKDQFNPYLLVYDSPVATLPDGSAVPREATSWKMEFLLTASDLLNTESRAKYYCDPNANWTDGEVLNAEDYRFTYEYYGNNSVTAYGDIINEVKVTGGYVAGVTLHERRMFSYRTLGALPILPKHIWENGTTSWDPTIAETIGSGPFTFSAFTPNSSLTLTRNAAYYPEVDTDAPTLRSFSMIPEEPIPAESVVIRVFVYDRSRIESVTLSYTFRVGQINFTGSEVMIEGALGYEGTIPSRVTASVVDFEVEAIDIWGNAAIITTGSYTRETTSVDGDLNQVLIIVGSAGVLIFIAAAVIIRRRGD